MPYAAIFPGQGAALPGAGEAWLSEKAWRLITDAEDLLDQPLGRLLLEADTDELGRTRESQLAVLLTSLLAWDTFSSLMSSKDAVAAPPVAYAGHSLGQITALLASGAVNRSDGLSLAAERARLSQVSADANAGRMAALFGATVQTAEQACEGVDAWVANDNAPGQVVIAGTEAGLTAATERATTLGVRRAKTLDVGHAFHTPLLSDAAEGLRPLLEALSFSEPDAPIVANTDARAHTDPACWPDQLSRHLVEPVQWLACQETLATMNVDTLVEIGPGRVLAGLAKRTLPDVRVLNVATPSEAAAAAAELAPAASLSSSTP